MGATLVFLFWGFLKFIYGFVLNFTIRKRTHWGEIVIRMHSHHQDHSPANVSRTVKAAAGELGHRVSNIDTGLL